MAVSRNKFAISRLRKLLSHGEQKQQWLPVANLKDDQEEVSRAELLTNSHSNHDLDALRPDEQETPRFIDQPFYQPAGRFGSLRLAFGLRVDMLKDKLLAALACERDTGIAFPAFTILYALGIIIYFSLEREPAMPVLLATAFGFALGVVLRRHHDAIYWLCVAAFALSFGMVTAQIRTMTAISPAISGQVTANLSGRIVDAEPRANGSVRYLIAPTSFGKIKPENLPKRLRVSARKPVENAVIDGTLTGLARIRTYSGPPYPGGFDFSFLPRFEGIGGSGFFMGSPKAGPPDQATPLSEKIAAKIATARQAISKRIRSRIEGPTGSVAVALITGERTGIPEDVQESLRLSGLAHILAISGLHMGLVTLTIMFLVRRTLSMFPQIAQTLPIRKYAAIAGFVGASFYLVLSGNSIASQRAWLMISVMLLAMVCDRRALTMRSVAIAAFIILLVSPEAVFSAGFQMSFAAVSALVAAYGWMKHRRSFKLSSFYVPAGPIGAMGVFLITWLAALAMTSLIAGSATGLFSAWHFHRVALYGVAANLLAMPIVSLVVMPFALLAMLAMPYGFEGPFLSIMSHGIDRVIAVSNAVNQLGSEQVTGALSPSFLILGASGLIVLVTFHTKLRLMGVLLLIAAFGFARPLPMPDVLVSEDGRTIAVRFEDEAGKESFVYPYPKRGQFLQDIWNRAWPATLQTTNTKPENYNPIGECNKDRCIINLKKRGLVHVVYAPKLLKQACAKADVLIAPRLKWVRCRASATRKSHTPQIILKREDFENGGAQALFSDKVKAGKGDRNWRVEASITSIHRPWSRQQITYQDNKFAK